MPSHSFVTQWIVWILLETKHQVKSTIYHAPYWASATYHMKFSLIFLVIEESEGNSEVVSNIYSVDRQWRLGRYIPFYCHTVCIPQYHNYFSHFFWKCIQIFFQFPNLSINPSIIQINWNKKKSEKVVPDVDVFPSFSVVKRQKWSDFFCQLPRWRWQTREPQWGRGGRWNSGNLLMASVQRKECQRGQAAPLWPIYV